MLDTSIELFATHPGVLTIDGNEIHVAVLNNGKRVLIQREVLELLTGNKGGTLQRYLEANNLKDYIPKQFAGAALQRAVLKFKLRGNMAYGFEATDLIDLCEMYLKARKDGVLHPNQKQLAHEAEVIIRSFAKVGIVAVIDEVTGFQKQKNEYQRILEMYIAEEMRPWVKTFDDNFYQELYRLLGWNWDSYTERKVHPQYIGTLTNRIVYEKLGIGILEKLKEINPKNEKGKRKGKLHQNLSQNEGYVALIKHLASITMIMERFDNGKWADALQAINERFPTLRLGAQMALELRSGDRNRMERAITIAAKPAKSSMGKAA